MLDSRFNSVRFKFSFGKEIKTTNLIIQKQITRAIRITRVILSKSQLKCMRLASKERTHLESIALDNIDQLMVWAQIFSNVSGWELN